MNSEVEDLIRRARHEESSCVSDLLAEYRNYLRVLAQTWLPQRIRSQLDASDLVQDTMVKAVRGFPKFVGQSEAELTAWLRKILARTLIDEVRKRDRSNELALNQELSVSGDRLQTLLSQSGTSPSQEAGRRELGVLLADALSRLPERQRKVIILRNLKELEWRDVATEMDRTISSVRAMWLRALANLRTELEEIFG